MLFRSLLQTAIRQGAVRLIDASNRTFLIGDGQAPVCTLRLKRRHLDWSIALNPSIRLAEAYMDGLIIIEDGTLYDFLDLLVRNSAKVGLDEHWLTLGTGVLLRLARRIKRYNPIHLARRNVAHHYDLSEELYGLFLDDDMQYSCAYFREPGMSLERGADREEAPCSPPSCYRPARAQGAGHRLRLGRPWALSRRGGGLRRDRCDAVRGAAPRQSGPGAGRRAGRTVRFDLRDYREIQGSFDRIVSVGMFEHVGKGNYPEFFDKIRDLLAETASACCIRSAGPDGPGPTNPFMRKYIFPGGYVPCLSEVLPVVERRGLLVTDIEILRLHYAETLRHWRQRFQANRERIRELYDERFCRMWEIYLAGAEAELHPPEYGGVPDPAHQASGCRAAYPGLHGAVTSGDSFGGQGRLAPSGPAGFMSRLY